MVDSKSPNRKNKQTTRRRRMFVGVWFVFVLALVFGTISIAPRVILWLRTDAPITGELSEIDVWTFFYPELERSNVVTDSEDDKHFDVLFLGGSVLEQVANATQPQELNHLANGQRVRLYNLCKSAHTSRDSLLKMRLLKQRRFDLVIVYHGINEARMNCCAADEFQLDYSHCDWYSSMHRRVEARKISFGEIVLDASSRLIPLGEPKPDQAAFGSEIKTPPAFEANMREIAEICERSAGTRIVVGTFALRLPEDYSRERFENDQLGYAAGQYDMVAESWGQPDAVRDAVAAHNAVLRKLGEGDGNIQLIDIASDLETHAANFCDPCHLTPQGIQRFKSLLLSK